MYMDSEKRIQRYFQEYFPWKYFQGKYFAFSQIEFYLIFYNILFLYIYIYIFIIFYILNILFYILIEFYFTSLTWPSTFIIKMNAKYFPSRNT